ncbi:uncharacterized protein RJT20DRAFT_132652 [Scheffersomyces xylosifermentans]|uniref:uncharacterized protein n=1 Tax=Scheffersomyces xylosifermentans TaxID=1304137 RepID=UPI00315D0E02
MHHHKGFSFDKFKNKVASRRSSESSIFEAASNKSVDRRNSVTSPMIVISESNENSKNINSSTTGVNRTTSLSGNGKTVSSGGNPVVPTAPTSNTTHTSRLRAQSLSLIHSTSPSRSRSRSRSIANGNTTSGSKKQTKELIKQETASIISKKLLNVLQDLGLQHPIPLKTTNNSASGGISKSAKVYVANSNDCIFLGPASSASFTYEDVENGGAIPHQVVDDEDDEDDEDDGHLNSFLNLDRRNRRGSMLSDDESAVTSDEEASPSTTTPLNTETAPKRLKRKMRHFYSPNYLCTKIDADTPIPHTFAVIIEIGKDFSTIKDLRFEFQSVSNILWPSGDPYNRIHTKERFVIGHMEWKTTMNDADFYINTTNSNDVKIKHITPDDLARRTREYKLVNVRDLANGVDGNNRHSSIDLGISGNNNSSSSTGNEVYRAGLYVFLLPIILPQHIPPSIVSINGTLIHSLNVNFQKNSDKLNRKVKVCASYNLPMVRTPPSFANSIADKPIYVNRVWNDALHYIITFPKKYIPLGSEHVINVKLVPLVKDVIIKRIKFNVLERITYVSKNLSKEYDYDSEDPYCVKGFSGDTKARERVISLCELKTKSKTSNSATGHGDPYKEEVVKCPDNNLLFSCYEPDESGLDDFRLDDPISKRKDPKSNKEKDTAEGLSTTMIASPLDINIALPFLTTRLDKQMMTFSGEDDPPATQMGHSSSTASGRQRSHSHSQPSSRKASISVDHLSGNGTKSKPGSPSFSPSSPRIGALETNLSHPHNMESYSTNNANDYITPNLSTYLSDDNTIKSTPPDNIQQGYTLVSKALYPDSNYRHIQIHHRLQVCFRISKPDPKDDFKMHHYEVVVDTPLILLSSKCNDASIQLPRYDDLRTEFPISGSSANGGANDIMFRTPNFDKNGITIKRLDEEASAEQLPSFEEATSSPSSPITRSISFGEDPLSRVPSITSLSPPINPYPNEPAPAYEESPSPTHSRNNSYVSETVNIDELVNNDSTNSSGNLRQSKLRSSLSNSFAPVLIRSRNSSVVSPVAHTIGSSESANNATIVGNEDIVRVATNSGSISSGSIENVSGSNQEVNGVTGESLDDLSTAPTTAPSIADSSTSSTDSSAISPTEVINSADNNLAEEASSEVIDSASAPSVAESTSTSTQNEDEVDSIVYLNNSNADVIPRSPSTALTSLDTDTEDISPKPGSIDSNINALQPLNVGENHDIEQGNEGDDEHDDQDDYDPAETDQAIAIDESDGEETGEGFKNFQGPDGKQITSKYPAYEMRLPLLKNVSTGAILKVKKASDHLSIPGLTGSSEAVRSNAGEEDSDDSAEEGPMDALKVSTDNLSIMDTITIGGVPETRAQDIYHTYI